MESYNLSHGNSMQQISLYDDDMALFIRPVEEEMNLTKDILAWFGEAAGLQTNLQKSCYIPIQCTESQIETVGSHALPLPSHGLIWVSPSQTRS